MRSVLAFVLMVVVTMVGCAAPAVGDYDGVGGKKLPKRSQSGDADDDDDDSTEEEGTTVQEQTAKAPPTAEGLTLTIASTGGGQGDITCDGGPCTATFAAGTKVTLAATPKSGSIFTGWTGGGCTGSAPCSYTVGEGTAPSAKFETLAGNWVGTYTNNQPNGGCKFMNAGAVTQAISGTPGSYKSAATAIDGLEIRNLGNCSLVDKRAGASSPSAATVNGDKVTGSWAVAIQGISGNLNLPFTATIKGNKMTGTWTCTNCTGGFEVTKQ